jgi:hypothetical protein
MYKGFLIIMTLGHYFRGISPCLFGLVALGEREREGEAEVP